MITPQDSILRHIESQYINISQYNDSVDIIIMVHQESFEIILGNGHLTPKQTTEGQTIYYLNDIKVQCFCT